MHAAEWFALILFLVITLGAAIAMLYALGPVALFFLYPGVPLACVMAYLAWKDKKHPPRPF